jgi:hypothetical protein
MRRVTEVASLQIEGAWAARPRTSIAFDLRQEPGAGKPLAGICAGGAVAEKERAATAAPEGRARYNELKQPFLDRVKANLL